MTLWASLCSRDTAPCLLMLSWAPWRHPDWQGIECTPFAKLPTPPSVKLQCLGKADLSPSFRLPRCCQPLSALAALPACGCSHRCCLLERVDAPGSCEPGFPSCLSQSSSLRGSLLISVCQAAAGQCCFPVAPTLEALPCSSLLSLRALPEDCVVAADEHLADYSHGKFRLGIAGRSGFQSGCSVPVERGKNSPALEWMNEFIHDHAEDGQCSKGAGHVLQLTRRSWRGPQDAPRGAACGWRGSPALLASLLWVEPLDFVPWQNMLSCAGAALEKHVTAGASVRAQRGAPCVLGSRRRQRR